jgi:Mce-associated membrane protein
MSIVNWSREHRSAAAALVLLTALAAASVAWTSSARSDLSAAEGRREARSAAAAAAQQAVPELLSYDAATLDDDLAAARDWITESFRDEFATLQDDLIQPAVEEQGFATAAEVTRVGVVEGTTRVVTLLVFVEQTTEREGEEPDEPIATRATVRMEKVDGRWLVGDLRPV